MTVALVLLVEDLVVKNPHYAYCMTLETGSWSWWGNGCFIYDTAPDPLVAAASFVAAISAAKFLRWFSGAR